MESGAAGGILEALDARARDSQIAAEEPLTESEAASTAILCQTGTGPGLPQEQAAEIKSGCVLVNRGVQCGERCGSYIK